ncbi:MAG: NADH-quinone oxidoreductase subunit C [Sphingobacteriales bacterium]|jgi:NADH-quinone oxidoreductase subunit C|nr:MAG: NADH-quinone oxidoreductase subunit C [Sphingobacteriales bacterium]
MIELIQQKINNSLPDAIIATEQAYDFSNIIIKKEYLKNVLQLLRTDTELNFHFLTTMCGTHFPDNSYEQEFGIMYQLHNMPKNWRIRIKAFMPKSDLNIQTVTDLWKTANWMERQEYDFFGFNFVGHPNLCRILNMDEMNYFPLRKEYPLEDLQRDDKDDKMFGR